MRYQFECPKCGEIEINCHHTEIKNVKECPTCKSEIIRIWTSVNSIWKCDGAYGKGE